MTDDRTQVLAANEAFYRAFEKKGWQQTFLSVWRQRGT